MPTTTIGNATRVGGRKASPRAPTPSTRSRSCRSRASASRVRSGCSTSVPVKDRSRGSSRATARGLVVGVDPTVAQLAGRARAGRADRLRPRQRRCAAVSRRRVRRGRRLSRVRAHREPRARDRGDRAGARARWPVRVLLEPSAAAGAEQRLDRRSHPRRAVLADRPLPGRGRLDGGAGARAWCCRSCTGRCRST